MAEQLNNKNIYKVYQIMDFLVSKYGFYTVLVREEAKQNEIWITNKDNPEINIIRISCTNLDETFLDKQRIQNILNTVSKKIGETKFLDIHISLEQVNDIELFDTLCLETMYHSGKDVNYVFPGIYDVIHEVDSQEEEIKNRVFSINSSIRNRMKNGQLGAKLNKIDNKLQIPVTYTIMAICVVVELIYYYLYYTQGSSVALYYLGADYYPLTVLSGQFWRLLTYGFLHGGAFHLIVNMYSFYFIGAYFERKHGKLKQLLILLTGIIAGGIVHNIMAKTSVSVGLSAGIYALFAYFILDAMAMGATNSPSFMMMIFINIALNFMPGIAWQAHLGGAIVGVIYYYMFKDDKPNYGMIGLLIVMLIAMIAKMLMG